MIELLFYLLRSKFHLDRFIEPHIYKTLIINKIKMKSSLSVIKPLKQRSKSAFTNNMFQDTENL